MFELPPASTDPSRNAAGITELFEHLARYRRNENTSTCAQMLAAGSIYYERLREEETIIDAGGAVAVGNSVYAEIGVALGCSATVAHTMIDISIALQSKFPMILDSFDNGILDYARIRVVVAVLGEASDDVLTRIETDVHAAALHFTPGPLRAELWRLWMTAAPEEARAARERNSRENRTAYIRRGTDGLSWLTAAITDLEGAEADRLLDEIAATVCAADPRTRPVIRADGLMALLHGEAFLTCRCGEPDCPNATPPAPRRGHLTQIIVDIQTLLGLVNNPAHLADGTPIDPDLARALAADSTWQGILAELHSAATDSIAPNHNAAPEAETVLEAECAPEAVAIPPAPSRRSRTRPPGTVRYSPDLPTSLPTPGAGTIVAAWLAALSADPLLCAGVDPTGHGGHTTPPDGALRYRPTAATAAIVRARHQTCVFPGCCVPSTKCELDHRVSFDHDDPACGGWTIVANLQPLCKKHHDVKTRRLWTCVNLGDGVILWFSPRHAHHITLPTQHVIMIPPSPVEPVEYEEQPVYGPPYRDDELLYEPTWWERMFHDLPPLTPRQIAEDPYLQLQHRQHQAIEERRRQLQPAPF